MAATLLRREIAATCSHSYGEERQNFLLKVATTSATFEANPVQLRRARRSLKIQLPIPIALPAPAGAIAETRRAARGTVKRRFRIVASSRRPNFAWGRDL